MVLTGGAGSMSITGSLDTSLIESGFRRIKAGFESVKGQVKGFTTDLFRINETTSSLVKKMKSLSLVGATAMLGLASGAPAVAGAMAQIGIQTDRLIRTLGEQFRPQFEQVAQLYTGFVNFVEAHPDLTKAFVFSSATLAGITAASKLVKVLKGVVSPTMLKALGSIGVIVAGGAVGSKAGEVIGEKTYDPVGQSFMESGIGETISKTFAWLHDKITGGTMSEELDDAYTTHRKTTPAREESRWDQLLNFVDWVTFWD